MKDNSGYPDTCTFAVQEKAWMNKELCIEWVKTCVKPWADRAPPGIIRYLFLDQFKCHLQEKVVTEIQNCGVEIKYIPGGCTSLCQPVDVGINKPFKNHVRRNVEYWAISYPRMARRSPSQHMNKFISFPF